MDETTPRPHGFRGRQAWYWLALHPKISDYYRRAWDAELRRIISNRVEPGVVVTGQAHNADAETIITAQTIRIILLQEGIRRRGSTEGGQAFVQEVRQQPQRHRDLLSLAQKSAAEDRHRLAMLVKRPFMQIEEAILSFFHPGES